MSSTGTTKGCTPTFRSIDDGLNTDAYAENYLGDYGEGDEDGVYVDLQVRQNGYLVAEESEDDPSDVSVEVFGSTQAPSFNSAVNIPGVCSTGGATEYNPFPDCDQGYESGLTYLSPVEADVDLPNQPPTVDSVDPEGANIGATTSVTISGSFLQNSDGSAPQVSMIQNAQNVSVAVDTSQASTPDTLYLTLTVPSGQSPVWTDIVVKTDAGQDEGDFWIGYPDASKISVSPSTWNAGQSTPITISGNNFGTQPTITISPSNITFTPPTFTGGSLLTTVTVPSSETSTQATITVNPGYSGIPSGSLISSDPGDPEGQASATAQVSPEKPQVSIDNHQSGQSYTVYVGNTLPLSATGTPPNGVFSWTSSGSAVSITPTNQSSVTLTGSSAGNSNVYVNYSVGQIAADPDGAVVHVLAPAYVTNFRQTNVSSAAGVLVFTYAWDSSTGNLSDLASCTVGEVVTYDPGAWPSPPYATQFSDAYLSASGDRGVGTDQQLNGGFVKPYSASNFNGSQIYRFMCPHYQGGNWVTLQSGIVINRVVSQVSGGNWQYTITKSGSSAQVNPLP